MSRLRVLIVIAALCALAGAGGIGFLVGNRYALANLTVVAATPDQLAAAMQGDHFYSDYNEHTVLVHGVVASLTSDGSGAMLQFQTQGLFTTRCHVDTYPATIRSGDTISVVAEGAAAQRLTSAVLLMGCRVLGG